MIQVPQLASLFLKPKRCAIGIRYYNQNKAPSLSFFHKDFVQHQQGAVKMVNKIVGVTPVSEDLKDNLFYNPNRESTFKHIEITEETIRLEFSSTDGVSNFSFT